MAKRIPRTTTFENANKRTDFGLNYSRSDSREFTLEGGGGIHGEDIEDAYGNGLSSGEWVDAQFPREEGARTDWYSHFFRAAICEAIHEGLEWFHVDGKPLLDPHGDHEGEIFDLSFEFAEKLYALTGRA